MFSLNYLVFAIPHARSWKHVSFRVEKCFLYLSTGTRKHIIRDLLELASVIEHNTYVSPTEPTFPDINNPIPFLHFSWYVPPNRLPLSVPSGQKRGSHLIQNPLVWRKIWTQIYIPLRASIDCGQGLEARYE